MGKQPAVNDRRGRSRAQNQRWVFEIFSSDHSGSSHSEPIFVSVSEQQKGNTDADGLTGRCYWEVKWSGKVSIAVAYKDISRTGSREASGFGKNDKSWALECHGGSYSFIHNNIPTSITGPRSSRVGVYLDHEADALCFYSITGTMTLLHKVKTKFTQPLYPGFWLE